ncbi:MAG: glucuronate isomerase [Anaerolineae bacterium]|nr:glucuronate isomerase [Anaerolineae bacterium]
MSDTKWTLHPDRFFDPDPAQRAVAHDLYTSVAALPLVCPHGHVNPHLFVNEYVSFGTPADLLIIPDHYVFRMLYSQGVPLEALGVPRSVVKPSDGGPVEQDPRKIWQTFAEHFHLFRGTPSGIWLQHELIEVFGVKEKPCGTNAQAIYDHIAAQLASPAFSPRRMFERFGIEVLCTTDAASDSLQDHQAIRDSGWAGIVLPTFRPDAVVNLDAPNWRAGVDALSAAAGFEVDSYPALIRALEARRAFFVEMGARATDHAALTAYTGELTPHEAKTIFQRALKGETTAEDATRFTGHMLMEMARMSIEDGMVMQIHVGSFRNHNQAVFDRFGLDKGCDIPVASEFTHNLRPLLAKYGNDPRLTLILFTLDEDTYSRELATLAGHYPALKLGPPWWFHDSLAGMRRYFDRITETAGLHNTTGFNDDTRAFPSIPARHDVWRRASANWVAGLVVRHVVDMDDAREMILDLAYRLAKRAYRL